MSDAKDILGHVLGLLPVPGDHGHPDEMVTFQPVTSQQSSVGKMSADG